MRSDEGLDANFDEERQPTNTKAMTHATNTIRTGNIPKLRSRPAQCHYPHGSLTVSNVHRRRFTLSGRENTPLVASMVKFKVILERIDTITKQAEIMIEANLAAEALQQIAYDLNSDPGAYDRDLQPIEDGVGEITIKVENQYECTHFPRAVAGRG
jgi:hypothetical protein